MNDYQRVDAIHAQWLCPPEYDDPVGRHKCDLCGKRKPCVPYYDLLSCIACEECVSDILFAAEDEETECSVCGIRSCSEMTVINGDTYCEECMIEAKIEYDDIVGLTV